MNDKFDPKFGTIELDMFELAEYVSILEEYIPILLFNERERITAKFKIDTQEDSGIAQYFQQLIDQGITTRFLTGSAIIAIWSAYESMISTIAADIADRMNVPLKLSHIRGDFLKRASTYFKYALGMDLHREGTDMVRLQSLLKLRNVFAHANGLIPNVAQNQRNKLVSWISETEGINVLHNEFVVVSVAFVRESYEFIRDLINDLVSRASK